MPVTVKQIAELAGVSRGTVDRALNGRGNVRPEVEKRILKIAEEMGDTPTAREKRWPISGKISPSASSSTPRATSFLTMCSKVRGWRWMNTPISASP